jgi:hypothetical protein
VWKTICTKITAGPKNIKKAGTALKGNTDLRIVLVARIIATIAEAIKAIKSIVLISVFGAKLLLITTSDNHILG